MVKKVSKKKVPVKVPVQKKAPVKFPVSKTKKRSLRGSSPSKSKRDVLVDDLVELELDPSVPRVTKKQGRRNYDRLRLEAMCIYVTDVNGLTVKELAQDPRFKGNVSIDTLQKWSDSDKWRDKRREAVEKVKKQLETVLVERLRDNLVWELQDLAGWRAQARHHSEHTPPDTWEGVVKVGLKVNERLAEIAAMVRAGVVDDVGRSRGADPTNQGRAVVHDFDPKELRAAATELTRKRRMAHRARIARTKAVRQRGPGGEG